MERHFMSRTSAVALLVAARRALTAELHEKPRHDANRTEQLLTDVERLLLDVRAGRTREFDMDYPHHVHVIVSD
jgi:hypothetical protein